LTSIHTELQEKLLRAHNENDLAQLVTLYQQIFDIYAEDNPDAAYFYLSNAYVFALDCNHHNADAIANSLRSAGRL